MKALETTELSGYTLNIYCDECPINPRVNEDNLGILYIPRPPRGCHFSDDNASHADALTAPVQIPVYCLDHSGIYIGPRNPGDSWDSWLAGVYYVPAKRIRAEYGDTPDAIERARNCALAELKRFSDYVAGDCYYYTIENAAGDLLDSCGGYIGASEIDYIRETFREFVDSELKANNPLFVAAGLNPVTGLAIA